MNVTAIKAAAAADNADASASTAQDYIQLFNFYRTRAFAIFVRRRQWNDDNRRKNRAALRSWLEAAKSSKDAAQWLADKRGVTLA